MFVNVGWMHKVLLYTKADPTPFGERDKEFSKVLTLLGSLDLALRLEAFRIRKDFWVLVDEVA